MVHGEAHGRDAPVLTAPVDDNHCEGQARLAEAVRGVPRKVAGEPGRAANREAGDRLHERH